MACNCKSKQSGFSGNKMRSIRLAYICPNERRWGIISPNIYSTEMQSTVPAENPEIFQATEGRCRPMSAHRKGLENIPLHENAPNEKFSTKFQLERA